MVSTIFALSVLIGVAFYAMSPDERSRVLRSLRAVLQRTWKVVTLGRPEHASFLAALRARTRLALLTPALVIMNIVAFLVTRVGTGAAGDAAALVGWGANFGPRTTNGEWWRLVTAMLVPASTLDLLTSVVALVPLGLVLERLVGPFAFAAVYVAAGILAGVVHVAVHPVAVGVGPSGAIFGLYGLFLGSLVWGVLHRSNVTVPLRTLRTLGPGAVLFVLVGLATDNLRGDAELAGFVTGLLGGILLTRGISEGKPTARRVGAALAVSAAITVVSAFSLRGVTDVRPELGLVVALEDRTAGAYEAALDRFRNGRITAEALAKFIDRTITPELQTARERLDTLGGVPEEHQVLVANAEDYLRLRNESWRLRAEGLQKASMPTLREADAAERASLRALQKIRPFAEP